MSSPQNSGPQRNRSLFYALFRRSLPLERETWLFVSVSAFDVFMTYILLRSGDVSASGREVYFYESNPVARFFLVHWGVKGIVYFKFALVAFVAVLAQLIARKKPETARKLLNFAIVVVCCVVIYSLSVLLRGKGML